MRSLAVVFVVCFLGLVSGIARAQDMEKYRVSVEPRFSTVRPGERLTFTATLELRGVPVAGEGQSQFLFDASAGRFEGRVYVAPMTEGNYKILVAHPKVFRSGVAVAWVKVKGKPAPSAPVATKPIDTKPPDLTRLQDNEGDALLLREQQARPVWRMVVEPAEILLRPGETFRFNARGYDPAGKPAPEFAPTWDATAGTVTPGGLYTAPREPGEYFVGITDPATFNHVSALVRVAGPRVARIEISPVMRVLSPGQRVVFSARGFDVRGGPAPLTPRWEALGGGSIDEQGAYTAPERDGALSVVFASDPETGVLAHVVCRVDARRAVTLEIIPSGAVLEAGASLQLRALARNAAGKDVSAQLRWIASAGSVDERGMYTAPGESGVEARIIAVDEHSALVAIARVQVR